MSSPDHPSLESRAEILFADLLVRRADPDEAELEALCGGHPELAPELRRLARQRRRLRSAEVDVLARAAPSPQGSAGSAAGDDAAVGRAGARLQQFELVRPLGRGGMGEVWEALDHTLQRHVALKLLRSSSGSARELSRFRREAEAAGRLSHRGIVAVLSVGEVDGRRYIAQELIAGGRTLRDLLEERRRTSELGPEHHRQVAEIFLELTDALETAHRAGVVHRDLKPQNILLAPDGSPKLADFGLARLEGDVSLSQSGDFVGTYYYASPEQVQPGAHEPDARSDVFGLGVTLYECLTLRRPFDGDSIRRVVHAILSIDPPDPRTLFSRVPADLAVICRKALEKRPEARYASMAAFHEDLRRHLANESILARPPSAPQRAQKWIQRHPTRSTALALSVAAFALVSALLVRTARARDAALVAQEREAQANTGLSRANVELAAARDEALSSAREASAAADLARRENEAREQVIAFLTGLFEASNPELAGENPSAQELLARGSQRIDTATGLDPEVRARLLGTMGAVHEKLGLYHEARAQCEQAVGFWQSRGLVEHPEARAARTKLANITVTMGELVEGERLLAPLVAEVRADPAFEAELAWIVLDTQANLLLRYGRFDEARPLLDEVQGRVDALFGARSLESMGVRIDQGQLELAAGRLGPAEACLRAAIDAGREHLASANPMALGALNGLGLVLTDSGRLDEAEDLFLELIADLGRRLAPDHPSLFTAHSNLARVLEARGDLVAAEQIYREVMEARLALLGPDAPDTLLTRNNLAYVLLRTGRLEEALAQQSECVRRSRADEPSLSGRRLLLGDIRAALGLPREEPPLPAEGE